MPESPLEFLQEIKSPSAFKQGVPVKFLQVIPAPQVSLLIPDGFGIGEKKGVGELIIFVGLGVARAQPQSFAILHFNGDKPIHAVIVSPTESLHPVGGRP